eukprot:CAMPEP_0119125634 /NCGR_PEP_ID=MMETSP1310-20130426/4842_1 /TAXON_ID=464262 /ORGANISM="Genus nov. species nov., Strain RCC2339" /LENGTH=163 /DNA_ID=CAMNT_0007115719 /DNA_START=61 /DNA_END=549 /DNA_ORIENTATION=-
MAVSIHSLTSGGSQTREEFDDKYDLQDWLGEGASCTVQLGLNKESDEEVAVKVIARKLLEDNEGLLREIGILRKLDHPNIVKLHEVFLTEESLYIVMELVCGMPLFDAIMENKNYSEEHARVIVGKLLEALKHTHERGVVHRDLKPENILFNTYDESMECLEP